MNSLRFLASQGTAADQKRDGAGAATPIKATAPPSARAAKNELGLVLWVWQWMVFVVPFLARIRPLPVANSQGQQQSLLKRQGRKMSKSKTSRSAGLPPIPKSFAPRQRKLLVLDLDETLVHTMNRGVHRNCQMVEVHRRGSIVASFYYVAKRPFCLDFSNAVTQWYDSAIFTASSCEYADPIIDSLERDLGRRIFKRRSYRDSCIPSYDGGYIKDLTVLDEDLHRVILVDNSPVSFERQRTNGSSVEGWISDPSDRTSSQLSPSLFASRHTTDVRSVLALQDSQFLCS